MTDILSKLMADEDLSVALTSWLSVRDLCGVLPRVSKLLHAAALRLTPTDVDVPYHGGSFAYWVARQPDTAARLDSLIIEARPIMPHWPQLANLRSLCLQHEDEAEVQIHDVDLVPLSCLTRLTCFSAVDQQISTDGVRTLAAALGGLQSLTLRDNTLDSAAAVVLARRLPQLTYLDVASCSIGHIGAGALATLPNLAVLDISDNNDIADDGLRAIGELTTLSSVSCLRIGCTAQGLRGIERLTNLIALHVQDESIMDTGACALAQLSSLRKLHCMSCGFSDVGAKALACLTHLTHLNASHNRITTRGAQHFSRLSNLQRLLLAQNAGISALSGITALTSLQVLSLWGTAVTNVAPLTALVHLDHLHIPGGNGIDGIIQLKAARPSLVLV